MDRIRSVMLPVRGAYRLLSWDDPQERAREFESFVATVSMEDLLVGRCPQPVVEWVGVVHAGYSLAPGSGAEALLAQVHVAAGGPSGSSLQAYVMACYLDAAIYSIDAGIPSLVYGPVAENIHAIDERVSLSSLRRVTKMVALFAAGWCGVPPSSQDRKGQASTEFSPPGIF